MVRHQEGVEVGEEFAHAGDECDFLGFAFCQEVAVVIADDGVVSSGDEGGHVEGSADGGSSTSDLAPAPAGAGVFVEGSDAD